MGAVLITLDKSIGIKRAELDAFRADARADDFEHGQDVDRRDREYRQQLELVVEIYTSNASDRDDLRGEVPLREFTHETKESNLGERQLRNRRQRLLDVRERRRKSAVRLVHRPFDAAEHLIRAPTQAHL